MGGRDRSESLRRRKHFYFRGVSSCLVKWSPNMSHSIVCHHAVCCGQMNQASGDRLLLIGQGSLDPLSSPGAELTSWHSGCAVHDRPAHIGLQLFNPFHGHVWCPWSGQGGARGVVWGHRGGLPRKESSKRTFCFMSDYLSVQSFFFLIYQTCQVRGFYAVRFTQAFKVY